ncbi:MAG: response regulator [Desulfobulbaceae bacterium]|nr:response regulator [Desulfobulbaceae bacterium]
MTATGKVLIVDDDPMQRLFVRRLLEKSYEVEEADNGERALAILPVYRPSVVLMDIDMPQMDGLSTCERLRANPSLGFVKVIIISGRVTLQDRIRGYDVGADDYLPKPVNEAELLAKVGIMMRLKHAEEIDQLKSTVLGLMSHETATPLNGIMLAGDMLQDKCGDNPDVLRLVEIIRQSGKRLCVFVDKAKLLSQLKSGVEPRLITGLLATQLQKAVDKGVEATGNKNISFSVDAPEDLELAADWQLMEKVFDIMIENAVKFSTNEGEIRVTAEKEGDNCKIEIIDRGKGLDPLWIDSVFNEFAIQDLMRHQQGTGLSLAIAMQIVMLHGGMVKAANGEAGGAVFTITLPLRTGMQERSTMVVGGNTLSAGSNV